MMFADVIPALFIVLFFGILYLIIRYNKRWREPEVISIRYTFGVLFILIGAQLVYFGITAFIENSESPPLWAITLIIILFGWGIGALYTTYKLSNKIEERSKNEKRKKKKT